LITIVPYTQTCFCINRISFLEKERKKKYLKIKIKVFTKDVGFAGVYG